ncbi:hypothetical protein GBAR_LOCUS6262, partial [Geodia barretti]
RSFSNASRSRLSLWLCFWRLKLQYLKAFWSPRPPSDEYHGYERRDRRFRCSVTPSKKTLQLLRAQYHSQQQQHQRWVLQPGLVLGVPDVFSRRTLPVWQSRGGKIRTVGLKSWSHKPIGMPFQSSRKKSIHFLLMHNDEHTWYCTLPSHISSWSSECENIIYMPVCIVVLEVHAYI